MTVIDAYDDRLIPFEGCFNFRDLGGYRTSDGFEVRRRRLYRADGPHALTDDDRALLRELRPATFIDLRTRTEASERGSWTDTLEGARRHHLPMMDVTPDTEELEAWTDPAYVAACYAEMLEDAAPAITEALAMLTDPAAYPAVIHCSAGKDRTGVLSAVILGLLRVSSKSIVADYALSAPAMVRMIDWMQAQYPDAQETFVRIRPAIVNAEPETMRRLLAIVRDRYGSFAGYVRHLGIHSAIGHLRVALLEDDESANSRPFGRRIS